MIDELRAMAIFAETINQGSFRAAAKKLQLSPSVVSYQISQLESRLGVALLYRSTRSLSLTMEGKELYEHALSMLESANLGINSVTSKHHELRGTLKLTLPTALIRSKITKQIAQFGKQNPLLDLDLIFTDDRKNLIENGIDIALRAGEMEDCNLVATRIGEIERKLVCSYAFFLSLTDPIAPLDLENCNWIKLEMLPFRRTLVNADGVKVEVNFKSNISVNSVEAMAEFCIHGLGVATPPNYLVERELKNKTLIELLPEWRVEPIPLYAVWPNNVFRSRNAKRLLDFLKASVQAV